MVDDMGISTHASVVSFKGYSCDNNPTNITGKWDKNNRNSSWYMKQRTLQSIDIFLPKSETQNYNPPILPATPSTACLSACASRTTLSLSSSAHSAMNVAVSPTKPASVHTEYPDLDERVM